MIEDRMVTFTPAEAEEVFSGLMLGDGGLQLTGCYAQFTIALSGLSTLNYLRNIKSVFLAMGIECYKDHLRVYLRMNSSGNMYYYCLLKTGTSPLLLAKRLMWYPNGKKEVLVNIKLPPRTLAHWFSGDGNSCYSKSYPTVYTSFATCGFSEVGVLTLENKLHALSLHTYRHLDHRVVRGSGISINISQDSVDNFMHTIEPYMLEPYLYKIKYRGGQL